MAMVRNRKKHKEFVKFFRASKQRGCDFCNLPSPGNEIVESTTHFWVIKNFFPYDVWDSSGVKDHLLVIPKRHIDSIGHFNPKEQAAYGKIIGKYDLQGYSAYARAAGNVIKSVPHQHTHLMALDNKPKQFLLYLKSPRFMISK